MVVCPYCGKEAQFKTSKEFYGRDYGTNIYVCFLCDAYVGTHGRSKTPLGTMANRELREMRKHAHSVFDPLWRGRKMSRTKAYKWMQSVMGLSPDKAHIGMFNEDQCWKLIKHVRER